MFVDKVTTLTKDLQIAQGMMQSNARKLYEFELRVSKLNSELKKSSTTLKVSQDKSEALSLKLANIKEDKKSNEIISSLQRELNEVRYTSIFLK